MEQRARTAWLAMAMVAVAGAAAVLVLTRQGPGLSPDSVHYVAGARSLLAGRGFSYPDGGGDYTPITAWPPLYSVALALPAIAGVDPLAGARVVDAVLLGLMLLIVGRAVYARGGRSLAAALFAMLALLCMLAVLLIYTMVWSESLFVLLTLCALVALAGHLGQPSWWRLLPAAVAAGAAFMTRYPGIGLVAAGCLALLLWRKGGFWARLRDSAAFGALACLPAFLWMTRNVETTGTSSGRRLAVHLIDSPHLREGLQTVSRWLVPARLAAGLRAAVLCVLLVGAGTYCVLLWRRWRAGDGGTPARQGGLLSVMLLFVLAYVASLMAAMMLVHPSCDLGPRYLFPVLPVLVVVLTCAVADQLHGRGGSTLARAAFGLLCVAIVASNLLQTVPWALRTGASGTGFLSPEWRQSPIIARLAALPPAVPVYSNRGEAVYILTGRSTYSLPHNDGSERSAAELAALREALLERGAVLAYFTRVDRPYLLSREQLEAALPLRTIFQAPDGVVYQGADQ
jgi:4-amino-4-deoxy-L-arabinose transferase-like glycosyltransferase